MQERAAQVEREQKERARIAEEKALQRREREAAFTPDVRRNIQETFDEHDAYFAMCRTFPGEQEEAVKFRRTIERGAHDLDGYREAYGKNDPNLEYIPYCRRQIERMKELASRKNIVKENGDVWGKIERKMEAWKAIPMHVARDEDAQSLITEGHISINDLVIRVRAHYLSHVWEKDASAKASIGVVFNEIIEAI